MVLVTVRRPLTTTGGLVASSQAAPAAKLVAACKVNPPVFVGRETTRLAGAVPVTMTVSVGS